MALTFCTWDFAIDFIGLLLLSVNAVQFPSKLVERLLLKCSATAHKVLQRYAWKHFQNGHQDWRSNVQLQPPHHTWSFAKEPASYRTALIIDWKRSWKWATGRVWTGKGQHLSMTRKSSHTEVVLLPRNTQYHLHDLQLPVRALL